MVKEGEGESFKKGFNADRRGSRTIGENISNGIFLLIPKGLRLMVRIYERGHRYPSVNKSARTYTLTYLLTEIGVLEVT